MEVGQSNELDASKFVCDLSTLLVATIQEAKDRISQVEYIFCSQLYPTFQKNSKSLQKVYMEARKAAEEEYKEMHRKLTDQTEELYMSREKAVADKENLMKKISDLEEMLSFKDVEIEKGKELYHNLQQEIELKSSEVECKQMLVTQYEERLEELLNRNASERNKLELKLENMENCLNDLKIKFGSKTIELDDCKKFQEQLVRQNDINISELTKKEQLLSAHEKDKASLLSRLKDLENKTEELQFKDRDAVIPEKDEYYKHLVQKFESEHSELLTEKQKRRDLMTAYKSLKSQYNFLCARSGLIPENTLPKPKLEVENEPHSRNGLQNFTSVSKMVVGETTKSKESNSSGISEGKNATSENKTLGDIVVEITKVKKEMTSESNSDEERETRSNQALNSDSQFTSKPLSAPKWKTSRNSSSSANGKHLTSVWRGTRSRHTLNGPDPHDDFLDTPLENIRGNLAQAVRRKEIDKRIPAPASAELECDNSDDETELDINAEIGPEKQQPQALKRSPKDFKYVEPVRKKAQREALKGIECKQCKKFYDAVLPDGEDKSSGDGKNGFRCEHLDGVSRHRYRYAPPLTPEGFWNIGFDSEI